MQRGELDDLLWFLAVAEERSFTRAAPRLGTSQSTLSHTIKKLEARLGLRLLTRTTRSVAPTEAGQRLVQALAPRIEGIETDLASLMALRDKPSGTVRLTASDHAYQTIVWPKLRPVLADYPDIRLEVSIDNGLRNIVEERFDAGVRLGESVDRDMIAVRIGPDWRLVAVASPGYFAARPMPQTPQDLVQHDCINHRQARAGGLYAWEFEKDGRELRVRVDGQLTFNTTFPMIDAAISGRGIAYVAEDLVSEALTAGKLVQVLDDWSPYFSGYHLYYPSRRQIVAGRVGDRRRAAAPCGGWSRLGSRRDRAAWRCRATKARHAGRKGGQVRRDSPEPRAVGRNFADRIAGGRMLGSVAGGRAARQEDPMQARITTFKMRPDAAGEARALMERLKDEIMGQPGMRHCLIVMNADGSGHVVAMIDESGSSPEAVDRVRGLWHKFQDHLESMPSPEIYEVVADWSA